MSASTPVSSQRAPVVDDNNGFAPKNPRLSIVKTNPTPAGAVLSRSLATSSASPPTATAASSSLSLTNLASSVSPTTSPAVTSSQSSAASSSSSAKKNKQMESPVFDSSTEPSIGSLPPLSEQGDKPLSLKIQEALATTGLDASFLELYSMAVIREHEKIERQRQVSSWIEEADRLEVQATECLTKAKKLREQAKQATSKDPVVTPISSQASASHPPPAARSNKRIRDPLDDQEEPQFKDKPDTEEEDEEPVVEDSKSDRMAKIKAIKTGQFLVVFSPKEDEQRFYVAKVSTVTHWSRSGLPSRIKVHWYESNKEFGVYKQSKTESGKSFDGYVKPESIITVLSELPNGRIPEPYQSLILSKYED